jgi:hypothetical protein
VIDLSSSARQPRVRFPKLSGSPEGRLPTNTRRTTTPRSAESARTIRSTLIRDRVSRGSILDRYRGPAGRRLAPTNIADRVTPSSTGSSSFGTRTGIDRAPDSLARTRTGSSVGTTTPTSSTGRTPIDLSRGRGLNAKGRVDQGRLTTTSSTRAGTGRTSGRETGRSDGRTSGSGGRSLRGGATGGTGSASAMERGAQLNRLERVRANDPAAADRMRRQAGTARRLSDVALKTSLSATAGLIGRYGGSIGPATGAGGGYGGDGGGYGGKGYGGYYGHNGSSKTNWSIGIGLSAFWWSAGYVYPGCSWYYPYYRSNCYWYGYSSWCWPRYSYYAPIYSTYPVYYDNEPTVVVINGGGGVANDVEYVDGEVALASDEQPVAQDLGAPPSNPDRVEELARAASQYLKLGDHAFREGRYGDAVHFYAKSVEYAPDEGVLYLILSDALFATGDYHYAAYAIRKAAELDPTLFAAPVDKHSFYGEPEAFDRQLAVLELYLEDHYLDDDARLVLATNYLFGNRPAEAVKLLEHPFSEGVRGDGAGSIMLESAKNLQYGGR